MRRLQWYKRGAAYRKKVKSGEEWVKSAEYLFTHIMYCASVVYVEKVKAEE